MQVISGSKTDECSPHMFSLNLISSIYSYTYYQLNFMHTFFFIQSEDTHTFDTLTFLLWCFFLIVELAALYKIKRTLLDNNVQCRSCNGNSAFSDL